MELLRVAGILGVLACAAEGLHINGPFDGPPVGFKDARELVKTPIYKGMPSRIQKLLRLAVSVKEENWLRSGAEGAQSLRVAFVNNKAVKSKVAERCPESKIDCEWKAKDAMLCETLDFAGWNNSLGNVTVLENAIAAQLPSTGMYGVDWTVRAILLARWRNHKWRTMSPSAPSLFAQAKQRLLDSAHFKKLVDLTCLDVGKVRPDCHELAPQALFCDALAQATWLVAGPPKEVAEALADALERADAIGDLARSSEAYGRTGVVAVTQDSWLKSGGEAMRSLKAAFVNQAAVKKKVFQQCSTDGGFLPLDDVCYLRTKDSLLCATLEEAWALSWINDAHKVEAALKEALNPKTQPPILDINFLAATIARWRPDSVSQPQPDVPEGPYKNLRRRVIQHLDPLVERTCGDANRLLPGCWKAASAALLCQVQGQAAAASLGADRAAEDLVGPDR